MLIFYIWRVRAIWSSFFCIRFSRMGWVQVGRLSFDIYGGKGVVFGWHGRLHRLI